MAKMKLTYEETQKLLNDDYVEFERNGINYVLIYCQDEDNYILSERINDGVFDIEFTE